MLIVLDCAYRYNPTMEYKRVFTNALRLFVVFNAIDEFINNTSKNTLEGRTYSNGYMQPNVYVTFM